VPKSPGTKYEARAQIKPEKNQARPRSSIKIYDLEGECMQGDQIGPQIVGLAPDHTA
jgi:hypothetical protein